LNQWTSVVRWEFKQPTPFIRTREFLWQEGHTVHATQEEAEVFVFKILDLYAAVYEELLAVPVIRGVKSEGEKFAGGHMTTTVEAFVPVNGRAIQAATSHHLGQNFAKMFNINFEDADSEKKHPHQASWGLTTRSIGIMIMNHADDKGLVVPPRVAPTHVVFVPIPFKDTPFDAQLAQCRVMAEKTRDAEYMNDFVRVELDDRSDKTPGWKYSYWELQGVCIRAEVGPRDAENGTVRLCRRDNGEKIDVPQAEAAERIVELLATIQREMLERARKVRDESITIVTEWKDFVPALNTKKMCLVPWCETQESEDAIKEATRQTMEESVVTEEGAVPALTGAAKSLCIPLDQPPMPPGTKCFFSGAPARRWTLFGRSY